MTPDELIAFVHKPRPTYDSPEQMTYVDRHEAAVVTAEFRLLFHKLVIEDAKREDWTELSELFRVAHHCDLCSAATLSGAISLVANLFYKLNPGLSREEFVGAYEAFVQQLELESSDQLR